MTSTQRNTARYKIGHFRMNFFLKFNLPEDVLVLNFYPCGPKYTKQKVAELQR